ncbi:hypothetical protein RWE15_02340 [Virgibacillus halophilus]|uniref:Uncharacterized protein n=1 Tax=Tigheibacillus halophilus TaxID=361280 RepID=A0ABU5C2E5_9BACI|nr:hypothetical protein [Virgibacillus halophilus]
MNFKVHLFPLLITEKKQNPEVIPFPITPIMNRIHRLEMNQAES